MLTLTIDKELEKKAVLMPSLIYPARLFDDAVSLTILAKDKSNAYSGWMLCGEFQRLIRYRFSEIPGGVKSLAGTAIPHFRTLHDLKELLHSPASRSVELRDKFPHVRPLLLVCEITIIRNESDGDSFAVRFDFSRSDSQWTGLFTPLDFLSEFERQIKELGVVEQDQEYFSVLLPVHDVNEVMEGFIIQSVEILSQFQQKAHEVLLETGKAGTIVRTFNLPAELTVPAEQYLAYFTRFLRDLGVEATAAIEHRASDVLFSVTPADKTVALGKIRQALDVYLGLAASPIQSTALVIQNEIAVQRLESEILTLQGRFRMGMAEIELKNATIRTQETELELLRRTLANGSLLPAPNQLEAIEPTSHSESDREEIAGGLAVLKPLPLPGVEVNIPKVFRWLRDFLFEPDVPKE